MPAWGLRRVQSVEKGPRRMVRALEEGTPAESPWQERAEGQRGGH